MFGIDKKYAYLPISSISKKKVSNIDVFNFSVVEDESYVCNSVAVHNCTAPVYSADSLHSAVVEVIVKKGARFRYTTIQNWSNDVYNLVTKRAHVEEDGIMEWIDGNLGSRLTMKYPSCFLIGERAHGEVLSIAYASVGQHQDAGAKMIHVAPNTTSKIISKSVSLRGGRSSYRGMVTVSPNAQNAKSRVECDALILDADSRSDTYPVMNIENASANIEHEATVSKIGEEKMFYLMSRGLTEEEAMGMVVSGFIEPIVKELPLEYAVELNRLIELEMEGSVG
jgi:Fe-S cluster assembly protein SufB